MERSYPKQYNRPEIDQYRVLVSESLDRAAEHVIVEEEMDPDNSELILVDDASAFPLVMTDDPRYTDAFLETRADVVYVDEETSRVRFNGPVGGRRRGETWQPTREYMPLPALLWQTGVEQGVWVAVSSCPHGTGDRYAVTLVRVTGALLERGQKLSRELAWSESGREA